MIPLESFPPLNACLNSLCAVLLLTGLYFIKKKNVPAHKTCMISAFAVSSIFLACYLYYHYHHGATKFQGEGIVRPLYFALLISHTILAVANLPLILITFYRAFKGQFDKHRAIAKYSFSIWLYVSVTGVIVYLMLYQLYPAPSTKEAVKDVMKNVSEIAPVIEKK